MQIDPCDGRCRECGRRLHIVAVDDASLTVECDIGHCYPVEPDAFGENCLLYYLQLVSEG